MIVVDQLMVHRELKPQENLPQNQTNQGKQQQQRQPNSNLVEAQLCGEESMSPNSCVVGAISICLRGMNQGLGKAEERERRLRLWSQQMPKAQVARLLICCPRGTARVMGGQRPAGEASSRSLIGSMTPFGLEWAKQTQHPRFNSDNY